jgi:hypothetical protein
MVIYGFWQASKDQNKKLSEDLESSRTQLAEVKAELKALKKFTSKAHGEGKFLTCMNCTNVPCLTPAFFVAAESICQLQKDLDAAKESQRYAESHYQAGLRVLKRSHEENNKLKPDNQHQAKELESLKSQLV